MRSWKDVATLVRTKGLEGRFVVRYAAGLPFVLEEGMRVAFVPPQNELPREGVVSFVQHVDGDTYEIAFDSVKDESSARGLIGCHCLVKAVELGSFQLQGETGAPSWIGWRVLDPTGGEIGTIGAIVDNPAQSLLEVNRGQMRPAYIPLVDEFIAEVDDGRAVVVVDVPSGLLDL